MRLKSVKNRYLLYLSARRVQDFGLSDSQQKIEDINMLQLLSQEDIKELIPILGHRIKLIAGIKQLKQIIDKAFPTEEQELHGAYSDRSTRSTSRPAQAEHSQSRKVRRIYLQLGDESWIDAYEHEFKQQPMVWMFQDELNPTKVIRAKSTLKQMFARFFGMSGHAVTVPLENRKTVNSEWYTTTSLPGVFEEIRKNNRQHRVILHQDNASGHTSAEKLGFRKRPNHRNIPLSTLVTTSSFKLHTSLTLLFLHLPFRDTPHKLRSDRISTALILLSFSPYHAQLSLAYISVRIRTPLWIVNRTCRETLLLFITASQAPFTVFPAFTHLPLTSLINSFSPRLHPLMKTELHDCILKVGQLLALFIMVRGRRSAVNLDVIGGSVTTVVRSFRRLVHGRCGWQGHEHSRLRRSDQCVARLLNKNIISNGERSELIEKERAVERDCGVMEQEWVTGTLSHRTIYNSGNKWRGKRAREPPKNRWSLPPTDTHNHSGVTSPLGAVTNCVTGEDDKTKRHETQKRYLDAEGQLRNLFLTRVASRQKSNRRTSVSKGSKPLIQCCAVSSRPTTTSPFAAGRHTRVAPPCVDHMTRSMLYCVTESHQHRKLSKQQHRLRLFAYRGAVLQQIAIKSQLAQALTGHGGFVQYLFRFKLKDSPYCAYDTVKKQDVLHVLEECDMFLRGRVVLEAKIGIRIERRHCPEIIADSNKREKFLRSDKKLSELYPGCSKMSTSSKSPVT
ncbi:hypothetical protein EVAR_89081_1 [Eumeta japonica]|uniref:Mariner Mos1 transposase n=1 Tax=Eumeta variegata TaxID=151549 RepID=A0A4C1XFF9_EUMVA|nr:hypothetical protein EVAR_89081_1 [Eumeta japonica]